ncbi:MAG: sugar ABC transporter permease [Oscillospiraceae bacterium]|jgi:multiple sugar transport system permease protein|nr:sugar ABC transporter permease [Oscillospiraceae bacterium]
MRRTRRNSFFFIIPSLLGIFVFFLAPFAVVVYYAFIDNPINKEFVWFDNFVKVWNNAAFKQASTNTLTFSAIAVPLAVVLSLLLAMILDAKIPGKSRFRTFFLSPMMVPVASVVLIWQVIFHFNGAMNDWLSVFGWEQTDWLKSQYSQIVIVLLFLWKNLGYNMVLFMAALSDIPTELLEAAEVDGASPIKRFFTIKLRFLSPSILFVTIMSLISSFKVFREVYLLTGDYPFESLYMLQHFINNTFASLDYQKLSAAAIIMFVVMLFIIGALFVGEARFGKDVEGQ